jgi:ankyrin repeat protein
VDDADNFDQTPLGWATEADHEGVVRLLLATGQVDVNRRPIFKPQTPFESAMRKRHYGVAKLLFEASKKGVTFKDQKIRTFFHWAVSVGDDELVAFLLQTGQVDVNARDDLGETPMFSALQAGYLKVVK